ncbi:MAG: hypothetical protein K8R53_03990 [Bacteroidales bacterium]|nr:hypothetical protein [Bacteroidales bacterium]
MAKFFRFLLVYTLVLALAGFLVSWIVPDKYITPTLPFLYVFYFSLTLIIHKILLKFSNLRPTRFINYFMILTVGKLLFLLVIILIYSLLNREDAIQFILAFFILYVFYTVIELYQNLKGIFGSAKPKN